MSEMLDAVVAAALADDLDQLVRLHDRELDPAVWSALRQVEFPIGLALSPAQGRCVQWSAVLAETPDFDDLAADFAAIYLNHQFGASPYESVWCSEDGLACATPMFALRTRFAELGLRAGDWRSRFDDHLVLELQYLAHCFRLPTVDPMAIAVFIDRHPGRWLAAFCQRIEARCATKFYAALAGLTVEWLMNCRSLLVRYGAPAPSVLELAESSPTTGQANTALAYLPGGCSPGW